MPWDEIKNEEPPEHLTEQEEHNTRERGPKRTSNRQTGNKTRKRGKDKHREENNDTTDKAKARTKDQSGNKSDVPTRHETGVTLPTDPE